jgi:hypothetical protein
MFPVTNCTQILDIIFKQKLLFRIAQWIQELVLKLCCREFCEINDASLVLDFVYLLTDMIFYRMILLIMEKFISGKKQ